ncbi:MAG: histidine triad nucleotide-binding protein [gamma proteobacterium symbiont of Ctena orbiculata]|nr:MAG: histidine triad nucleotide-binding protein [gamma proteobacterium symbiont of Ctena orbiculata]PVV17544.1 MAG: histidine triad nucleotide-binding protein [gamma proteobacterium symbiont of Ctena orbiculata]PVV20354.1 MAG: histidine triad nucleotide-binding protein [gamma proteobacterium symbiont of Ctena orbiculata]
MSDCLFCKFISGEIQPDKVYEDEEVLAFRDINPQAPTHILIIPKRHIATLNELEPDDQALMGKLILTAQKVAKEEGIDSAGYRTLINCNEAAGQSVFHIHLHLLGGRTMQWPPG